MRSTPSLSFVSGASSSDAVSGRPSAYGLPVVPVVGPVLGLGKVYVDERDIPDGVSDVAEDGAMSSSEGDLDSAASSAFDDEPAQGFDGAAQLRCDAAASDVDEDMAGWYGATRDMPWGE